MAINDRLILQGRFVCGVPVTARDQITTRDLTHEELNVLNRSRILKTATFLLGSEGQGIGDPLDSMIFLNPDNRYVGCPNLRCVLSTVLISFDTAAKARVP